MTGIVKCASCGFASKNGDKATGRCQNALNENYARPLWAVSACSHLVIVKGSIVEVKQ
jgi:hypothetical protein